MRSQGYGHAADGTITHNPDGTAYVYPAADAVMDDEEDDNDAWGELEEADVNAEATGEVTIPPHIAQAVRDDVQSIRGLEAFWADEPDLDYRIKGNIRCIRVRLGLNTARLFGANEATVELQCLSLSHTRTLTRI